MADDAFIRTGAVARTPGMRRLISALLGLTSVLAACGDAGPSSEARTVAIDTFQFSPARLTVPAGATVHWENGDAILHTVTAEDGAFDLQLDGKGTTGERIFSDRGTFRYRCDRHQGMAGTVVVE